MTTAPGTDNAARLGVCSWSLQPEHPSRLATDVSAAGLRCVQLALDPIRTGAWSLEDTRSTLAAAGIEIASGMMTTAGEDYTSIATIRRTGGIRPDEHWPANLEAAVAVAEIAADLGLQLVTLHAGFLPEEPGDLERVKMVERLQRLCRIFDDHDVDLGLETGQESAETLVEILDEVGHARIGVNFDPANMLLYGTGDPLAALELLAPRVMQVHLKDATSSGDPDLWGEEVPLGDGAVDWPAFLAAVDRLPRTVDTMIEREAGTTRLADVRLAAHRIQAMQESAGPDRGAAS
ncbi:MAG: sugar phosphate isomerase/epimerase family protein [Phycisphaerales bacterium]